jgi:hypothetical protein
LVRDQVLGYAESVDNALPDIFEEAQIPFDEQVRDEVAPIAGIRKLDAICTSSALLLGRAVATVAAERITTIKIGASEYAEGSPDYSELTQLSERMRVMLRELELEQYLSMQYAGIVRELFYGRRQG